MLPFLSSSEGATSKQDQPSNQDDCSSKVQRTEDLLHMQLTFSSRSTGATPKKGRVAEVGVGSQAPGRGTSMAAPVSVCHQESMMGQRPSPTTCTGRIRWLT